MITGYPLETYEQRIRRKLGGLIARVCGAPVGRIVAPPFGPRMLASSVVEWYLQLPSGAVAFQPIGAADLAASYVNLLNPGTNNASAPGNAPDHSGTTGWGFDGSNSEYLQVGSGALFLDYPFTIAVLFRTSLNDTREALAYIGEWTTSNRAELLADGTQAGDPIRFGIDDFSNISRVSTTSGFSLNTWHTAIAVGASSTDRHVYIDGGSEGEATSEKVLTNRTNDTTLIAYHNKGTATYLTGNIGAWGVGLGSMTDAQVAVLHSAMIAIV